MTPSTLPVTGEDLGGALEALRRNGPLVQCITNNVVTGWTANVLLAVGASPAMVDNPYEAGDFAAVAGGLLVNLGTPTDATVAAMRSATEAANRAGTPWVLDPVAVGVLGWRTNLARELLAASPTVIRGNASEFGALAGGTGGRGTDSTESPEAVYAAARQLTSPQGAVAISGPVDHICDRDRLVRVGNGHELLTRVTGVGCSLGALVAAYAAVTPDPLLAAVAATAHLNVAGEIAAQSNPHPGSFAVALLDALDALAPEQLATSAHLS